MSFFAFFMVDTLLSVWFGRPPGDTATGVPLPAPP